MAPEISGKPAPFLFTDDYPNGLTQSQFRRLRRDEKVRLMVEWFRQHYEDPANETPYESAEGGYLYIWGGPYDAQEELYDNFDGLAAAKLIDAAVEEVQRDGYEWAPVDKGDRYDPEEEQEVLPDPLDVDLSSIPDEPGTAYASKEAKEARAKALDAIKHLESNLPPTKAGIGHNHPPEPIDDDDNKVSLPATLAELKSEMSSDKPDIRNVKKNAGRLQAIAKRLLQWLADKLADKALDATLALLGGAAMTFLPHLKAAFDAVVKWLFLVTSMIF